MKVYMHLLNSVSLIYEKKIKDVFHCWKIVAVIC